jgi:hypothetical protein
MRIWREDSRKRLTEVFKDTQWSINCLVSKLYFLCCLQINFIVLWKWQQVIISH